MAKVASDEQDLEEEEQEEQEHEENAAEASNHKEGRGPLPTIPSAAPLTLLAGMMGGELNDRWATAEQGYNREMPAELLRLGSNLRHLSFRDELSESNVGRLREVTTELRVEYDGQHFDDGRKDPAVVLGTTVATRPKKNPISRKRDQYLGGAGTDDSFARSGESGTIRTLVLEEDGLSVRYHGHRSQRQEPQQQQEQWRDHGHRQWPQEDQQLQQQQLEESAASLASSLEGVQTIEAQMSRPSFLEGMSPADVRRLRSEMELLREESSGHQQEPQQRSQEQRQERREGQDERGRLWQRQQQQEEEAEDGASSSLRSSPEGVQAIEAQMSCPSSLKDLSTTDIRQLQGEIEKLKEEYDGEAGTKGNASKDDNLSAASSSKPVLQAVPAEVHAVEEGRDDVRPIHGHAVQGRRPVPGHGSRERPWRWPPPLHPTSSVEEEDENWDADDGDGGVRRVSQEPKEVVPAAEEGEVHEFSSGGERERQRDDDDVKLPGRHQHGKQ